MDLETIKGLNTGSNLKAGMENYGSNVEENEVLTKDSLNDESNSGISTREKLLNIMGDYKISFYQRIKMGIFKKVFINDIYLSENNVTISLYAFKCRQHGIQFAYPSGWRKVLLCSECIASLAHER